MERIITSIKWPVLALADKYLPRSRKIQRFHHCVGSRNKYYIEYRRELRGDTRNF